MGGWLDRILDFRDALLASPGFQRRAASFVLSRPIARQQARAAFDLCAGFVYSQILLASVKVGLLERLKAGPLSVDEVARQTELPREGALRLLEAAATLALVSPRSGGRYGLGMRGAAIVANPGILRMIEHHELLYRDLADPVALLRGEVKDTALGRYWPYAKAENRAALSADDVDGYTTLMSASQTLVADEVLEAFPLDRFQRLLDIGGGDGTFLEAVGRRYPHLALSLIDLPPVADRARRRLEAAGLGHRASVTGGDFLAGSLPEGADIATLVRIVHDHSDTSIKNLLASVHRTLKPGGVLLIVEPLAGTAGAQTVGAAYFGFYLMAMGSGRPRTFEELAALLREAGFVRINKIPTRTPLQTSLVAADR